jgi:hypothetical protein
MAVLIAWSLSVDLIPFKISVDEEPLEKHHIFIIMQTFLLFLKTPKFESCPKRKILVEQDFVLYCGTVFYLFLRRQIL